MAAFEALSGENIEQFCRQVFSRNHEKAVGNLIGILDAMEIGGLTLVSSFDTKESAKLQTLLASAVLSLFGDPKFKLSPHGFSALMSLKTHLRLIFSASSFEDMRMLGTLVGVRQGRSVAYPDEESRKKLLMASTLDYATESVTSWISDLPQDQRLIFWVSCLESRVFVGEHEDKLRRKMLAQGHHIEDCAANSVGELGALARVWMNCSYWDYEEKHDAKRFLNQAFSNSVKRQGVTPPVLPKRRAINSRPKVLVVLETWVQGHAMVRCYSTAVQSLCDRFDVGCLVLNGAFDEKSTAMFAKVLAYESSASIKQIVGMVIRFKPDIIYYPSIGMQHTIIQLAQIRLAPIQMMTAGHPASSMSNVIDYMVLEEDMVSDPDLVSETICLTKKEPFVYQRPQTPVPQKVVLDDDLVHVAVSSLFYKLSRSFLEELVKIAEECEGKVHFHFLAGLNGFNRISFEKGLKEILPATCYEMMPYDRYLAVLAGCQIQMAPFPFGNANGFVDAMLTGIPVVCLDGREIHSHTDAAWAHRVGLPETCITNSLDAYRAQAVKMILENDYLKEITQTVESLEINQNIFGESSTQYVDDFANLVDWLNLNHELVQSDGRKVWQVADRNIQLKLTND